MDVYFCSANFHRRLSTPSFFSPFLSLFFSSPLFSSLPPLLGVCVRACVRAKTVLNVWDSGNYTAGWDDDEGGTAGWTELGPLLDAHSWGGGREHSRPKVRMPKKSPHLNFLTHFPPHHIDPSNPPNALYQLRSPNKCPPFGFFFLPSFHYIRLAIIVTNQEISTLPRLRSERAPASPNVSISFSIILASHHIPQHHHQHQPPPHPLAANPGVRCLTEMVSCFLPAAVSAWHGHIMKSSPLPTSENPIFSISSWRCMTDRVSPWRSKGQLLWTLWRRKK